MEEQVLSNVKGVLGKAQLDPQKVEYIQKEVFKMFPLESKESHDKEWSACVGAIDEANR